jgi:poly-gamma-glutamate synthesis protein (capsule biosynthesis protein)
MLGRLVNEALKPCRWIILGRYDPGLESDCIGNLECVIRLGAPWGVTPKVFHFRTDAKNIEALKIAGFNMVSIANNHSLDYEYKGLFEMIKTLEAAGIHHAGAGANADAACSPAFIEAGGSIVGCIAFTDNEPAWEAVGQNPGVCYVPIDENDGRARQLFELVAANKERGRHRDRFSPWGPNWGYQLLPEHIHFGRLLVENGADIVFLPFQHVFRAVEIYRGRPIFTVPAISWTIMRSMK